MADYEITKEDMISWAINYATYDDLEEIAKSLYGLYVQRRKHEHPQAHSAARQMKKKYTKKYGTK
jgi:hypothetical protein